MAEYGNQITSPITAAGVWQLGGAVARVGEDETAFNGRGAGHTFNLAGGTESAAGFEEEREWAKIVLVLPSPPTTRARTSTS